MIASRLPQHAAANREVLLGGQRVAYLFQRSRRRTIGFTVGAEGLTVRAPSWVRLGDVDASLQEKSPWILRKLGESHDRRDRLEAARMSWADGAQFPFLGERLRVVLAGAALPDVGRRRAGAALAERHEGDLRLALPTGAAPADIRTAAHSWLLAQASAHFQKRLDHFAPLLQVRWQRLALTSAGTRWGSATSAGAIRLNWRLMHFRPEVVDYVVAHELAHLRHMDHSARFWAVVTSVVPEHVALRAELRSGDAPRWD